MQTTSNVFLSGRKQVDDRFKPGVQSIQLIFTDHDGGSPVKMPWWYTWQPVLRPVLEEVGAPHHHSFASRLPAPSRRMCATTPELCWGWDV